MRHSNRFRYTMSALFAGSLLLGLVASGCGSDGETTTIDCNAVTVPKYAEVRAFTQSCNSCHSSQLADAARNGAPPTSNFDTYDGAVAAIDRAMARVEAGTMPPAGALSDDLIDEVLAWGQCGTPQ